MIKKAFAVSAAAALVAAGIVPLATADHEPLVEISLGLAYAEDFEADDGGWIAAFAPAVRPPPASTWGWGAPTSGPGAAASGSNVWATNLAGLYSANDCGGLASPAISIPAAATASVSFQHWKHMEASTFSGNGFDGGIVFVTTDGGDTFTRLVPEGDYDAPLLTTARACLDGQATGTTGFTGPAGATPPGPAYSQVDVNLTGFAGQTVQVVLGFGSDSSVHRDGWYIDDFAVTIDDVTSVTDFEANDGGFTVIATKAPKVWTGSWAHGLPSTGPGAPTNVWATGLDGNFEDNECSWIESPPIDLSGLLDDVADEVGLGGLPATKATLRWQQWYRGSSTSTGGVVQIGTPDGYVTIEPEGGYPDTSISTSIVECTGPIDGAFAGNLNTVGDATTDMAADLSAFLGETVSVRFLFTSGTFNQEGWYIDNVEVETAIFVGQPHLPDGGGLPDLSGADAPGWTSGGEAKSWAYGVVTQSTSNTGLIEGEVGYKTGLADNSNLGECSWIQTPPIPGALFAANPTLVFEHWYRIPGTAVNVAWGGGLVMVSGDGGLTWDYLDLPEYDRPLDYSGGNPACFTGFGAPLDGNVFSGVQTSAFETVTADLSAYVGAPTVQVRFVFGTVVFNYEGWFLRDVQLGGVDVLP